MLIEAERVRVQGPDELAARITALAEGQAAAGRADRAIAFIEGQLREARDQFRYYGNLRAMVAWLPAVITVTMLAFIFDKIPEPGEEVVVGSVAVLGAVLAMIFIVQMTFQRRQRVAMLLARRLQEDWRAAIDGADQPLLTLRELSREVLARERSWRSYRPDAASWALAFFFVVLLTIQIAFVAHADAVKRPHPGAPHGAGAAQPAPPGAAAREGAPAGPRGPTYPSP